MTDKLYIYCILGVVAILCVLAFSLKLEKMVQIMIGNYILGLFFFALGFCIDLVLKGSEMDSVSKFFVESKSWILLLLYGIFFFFFVYRRSKIRIDFSSDPLIYKPLYLAFVPLTVISMLVTIGFIGLGTNAFSLSVLNSISEYTQNIYLQKVILNFPYIICGYCFLSLLAITDLKFKVKVSVSGGSDS